MSTTLEAQYHSGPDVVDYTPAAAITAGNVIQLANGRAAVAPNDIAASRLDALQVAGLFLMQKTTGIVLLDGTPVYWDTSAGKVHFRPVSGQQDFYLGTVQGDAASADTVCYVRLNELPRNTVDLRTGVWNTASALGEGVTLLPGGGAKLSFDAVAEIAMAAIYSAHGVPVAGNPILRARLAIHDIGNAAALDITAGLASGTHATDFQSVAEFAAIHLDGNDLSILVQSDDGTTDVAPVDSTIDAVDDTEFELWIDCRDLSDVKIYVDGVLAVPDGTTLSLAAASGPLVPIVHIEKTSDDTTADVRVSVLEVRTADQ